MTPNNPSTTPNTTQAAPNTVATSPVVQQTANAASQVAQTLQQKPADVDVMTKARNNIFWVPDRPIPKMEFPERRKRARKEPVIQGPDGKLYDKNGKPIDEKEMKVGKDGKLVDKDGKPVEDKELLKVGPDGKLRNEDGELVNEKGEPVDANGNVIKEKVDKKEKKESKDGDKESKDKPEGKEGGKESKESKEKKEKKEDDESDKDGDGKKKKKKKGWFRRMFRNENISYNPLSRGWNRGKSLVKGAIAVPARVVAKAAHIVGRPQQLFEGEMRSDLAKNGGRGIANFFRGITGGIYKPHRKQLAYENAFKDYGAGRGPSNTKNPAKLFCWAFGKFYGLLLPFPYFALTKIASHTVQSASHFLADTVSGKFDYELTSNAIKKAVGIDYVVGSSSSTKETAKVVSMEEKKEMKKAA